MIQLFAIQNKSNQKLWETVMSCSEVHPRVYCIMHSATIPDFDRMSKLPKSGESKRGEKKVKKGERVDSQNKAVKSLQSAECSNMVAGFAGSCLLSPNKTLWRLCCTYSNVGWEIFTNSAADKWSCHLMIKYTVKHIQCRHFPENWNCERDVIYVSKYGMCQLYVTYLLHKLRRYQHRIWLSLEYYYTCDKAPTCIWQTYHVHYGDLILRVLDCIVTISLGV